jgi:uncharacterized protein (TIGR03067 family)
MSGCLVRHLAATGLFVFAGVALAAPRPKDPPIKDPPIVGEWEATSITTGKIVAELPPGAVRWSFTADGHWVQIVRGQSYAGKYKTNSKDSPARVDFSVPPPGPSEKAIGPGIYKVEGDTLTVCYRNDPGERPTEFKAAPTSNTTVVTFKRVERKD